MSSRAPVQWEGGAAHGRVRRWWSAGGEGTIDRALGYGLAPAELLYRGIIRARSAGYRSGVFPTCTPAVPAISVGNLQVGGTGKTPVTAWLARQLQVLGGRPAVLHGGYGSDEPELHRRSNPEVPVFVGRDRCSCAESAARAGANVLVLDDGFQHRRLRRTVDLVLVSAEGWSAEPRLLPRGPWREPPSALGRADAVGITRKAAGSERARIVSSELAAFAPRAERMRFWLRPGPWRRHDGDAPGEAGGAPPRNAAASPPRPSSSVLAVAALAEPHLFLDNVHHCGVEIERAILFPDHHEYSIRDMENIIEASSGKPVATTGKDAIKLSWLAARHEVWILDQSVEIEEGAVALTKLLRTLV